MKCYQADYPRPQFVRAQNSWENLNGSWDFSFDDNNEGITRQWFASFPGDRKINVPFAFECPASGIGDPSRHDVVWYSRPLFIDSGKRQGRRVLIHFEGSDYNTGLWVNGGFAGAHEGAYARFSFDITHLVKEGNNTLTVRAEDSFDISQPRGKQRWKDKSFGSCYIQTTGIWKTVWLEYVNSEHIASIKMTPDLSRGKLEIEAEIAAPRGEGWGYGSKVGTKEEYVKRFDAITTAIKKTEGICGFCYTQVTDIQQEINGIMDIERGFKVEPEILKEINERKVSSFYRL